MNINHSTDVADITIKLSRLARKIGINTNDYPLLGSGNPSQCLEFAKRIVFYVVRDVAQDMINRRITEQSPDKRVVLAIFDMLRESAKKSVNTISADQFLLEGRTEHKLLILIKLVEHVLPLSKSQTKVASPSPTKLQARSLTSPSSSHGSAQGGKTSESSLTSSDHSYSHGQVQHASSLSLTDLQIGSFSPGGVGDSNSSSSGFNMSGVGTESSANDSSNIGRVSFEDIASNPRHQRQQQPVSEEDYVFQKLMTTSGNANYDTNLYGNNSNAALTAKCEALVMSKLVPFQKQVVNMVQELNMNIMRSNMHIDARLAALEGRLISLENSVAKPTGGLKSGLTMAQTQQQQQQQQR